MGKFPRFKLDEWVQSYKSGKTFVIPDYKMSRLREIETANTELIELLREACELTEEGAMQLTSKYLSKKFFKRCSNLLNNQKLKEYGVIDE